MSFAFTHDTFELAKKLWNTKVPSRNQAYESFRRRQFREVAKRIRYLKALADSIENIDVESTLTDCDQRLCLSYKLRGGTHVAYLNRYDWALVQDDTRFTRFSAVACRLLPLKID